MELKEDMYVRTKLTDFCNLIAIRRIIEIDKDANEIWLDDDVIDDYGELYNTVRKEDIDKASNYIIDLIEEGDYVNGCVVLAVTEQYIKLNNPKFNYDVIDYERILKNKYSNMAIKDVVTKEQFENMMYVVESE